MAEAKANNTPGSVFLITSDGRTLRLPIPSPCPDDPLNWSGWKRISALGTVFFFTICALVQVQGTSLLLAELRTEYSPEATAPFRVDVLASIASLFQGIGTFVWIPLSLALGRRPVLLLCALLLTLSTGWAAVSANFYQHLTARSLQGLAAGVVPSTNILMVIDLTFTHQRPQAIATYWSLCAVLSNIALAPTSEIISGASGWRRFYGIGAIPSGLAIFLIIFFCPETYFHRPAVAFDGHVLAQNSTESIRVYRDWKDVPGGKPLPTVPETTSDAMARILGFRGAIRKPRWKAMGACYPLILLCILNPMIFWVLLLDAVSFGGLVSISATYADLLHGAPYFLPFGTIALIKLGAAAGALLAWPASGLLIAHVSRRLTMQNRGVRDAEHYLPAFILPVLTGAASLALYGVAGQNHWHWRWIFISHAFNYFSFISLFTASSLWATSVFPRWAAAALVAIGGAGYTVSFGLSFAIMPWVKRQGFARANIQISLIILAVGFIGIPIGFWGKRLRAYIHKNWGLNEGGALRPRNATAV